MARLAAATGRPHPALPCRPAPPRPSIAIARQDPHTQAQPSSPRKAGSTPTCCSRIAYFQCARQRPRRLDIAAAAQYGPQGILQAVFIFGAATYLNVGEQAM